MASLWTTHVLEPGKTYDELNPNEKRPFTDDEQRSVKGKINEHVKDTVKKYFDHIHAGEDSRVFTPGEIAYLIAGDLRQKVRIMKVENDTVFFNYYYDLQEKYDLQQVLVRNRGAIKKLQDQIKNKIKDRTNTTDTTLMEKLSDEVTKLKQDLKDARSYGTTKEDELKTVEDIISSGERDSKNLFIKFDEYHKVLAIVKDEEQYLKMQQNKTYQFVMLLASYTNEKVEKFFDPHDSKSVHTRMLGASGNGVSINRTNTPNLDGATQSLTKWYHNIEWADGLVHLTPMIYGHIEEAYTVIKQKWGHLRHVSLHKFTDSLDVRSMFARLVAMGIRTSDVLSGRRYHLQSTYSRVNMEKMRLINYWHHVKYNGKALVYDPSPPTVDQISTIQQQFVGVDTEDLFKFTKDVKRMNSVNNLYTF